MIRTIVLPVHHPIVVLCCIFQKPVVSGATLIISPFSIAHQWVDEILKHVPKQSLNVFVSINVTKLATLIISPFSIAHQWVDEILKHVAKQSLNVFVSKDVTK